MQTQASPFPTTPGTPHLGGFYSHRLLIGNEVWGTVVAPKAEGQITGLWLGKNSDVTGALSCHDSLDNTQAMAKAGSKVAKAALACRIGGFDDWAIPARDDLDGLYRALKPTKEASYTGWRNGDNPSLFPAGYPYAVNSPIQTVAPLFQDNAAEAFDEQVYGSSTQCSALNAYYQYFGNGYQNHNGKSWEVRFRFVRRFFIGTLALQ